MSPLRFYRFYYSPSLFLGQKHHNGSGNAKHRKHVLPAEIQIEKVSPPISQSAEHQRNTEQNQGDSSPLVFRLFLLFRSWQNQNSVIWLVSAMPAKAPRAFSCSMWVLESLLQHRANSSMEMNSFPFRFSTVSWAAASPRP